MEYNVDYFIEFAENIPENKWIGLCTSDSFDKEQTCIMGHLGGYPCDSKASMALSNLLKPLYGNEISFESAVVFKINDGTHPKYKQTTPKQRILAALYDIKFKEVNHLIANIEEKELSTNKEKQNELSTY